MYLSKCPQFKSIPFFCFYGAYYIIKFHAVLLLHTTEIALGLNFILSHSDHLICQINHVLKYPAAMRGVSTSSPKISIRHKLYFRASEALQTYLTKHRVSQLFQPNNFQLSYRQQLTTVFHSSTNNNIVSQSQPN